MLRTLYYGSYNSRIRTWLSGFVLFLLLTATAFFGYILPWGQMSFWAATVITSLVSIIPFIGNDLLLYLWGGFAIGAQTLTRFYSIHFLLPFILIVLVCVHIILLHEEGSSDVLGVNKNDDKISFHPFFTNKDIVGIVILLSIFLFIVMYKPNVLNHPINYIEADSEVTPVHIVPEWYFLPFYGILRSIPSKIGGVLALLLALFLFAFFPFINGSSVVRNGNFRPIYRLLIMIFVLNLLLIGFFGGLPVEEPYIVVCQILTFFYYFIILVIFPICNYVENFIWYEINKFSKICF